jgi:RimJ/RimL family protein N-acetyltransferase
LRGRRIVAQTEKANLASQRVMEKLGMTLWHNPGSEPAWFETVGVLNNPDWMPY